MTPIDKSTDNLVPLYRQISDDLRKRIAAGEFRPGEPMPSEHVLCGIYNVSRITVRKALDELVAGRFVVRRQGVGTFVAKETHSQWSVTLTGVIEDVLLPYHFKVIREAELVPPMRVLNFARIGEPSPHKMVEGVNHAEDGSPLVHLQYYFPREVGALVSAQALVQAKGGIRFVENATGRKVDHAEQIVEPTIATDAVAASLQVAVGSALLRITRVFYDASGAPLQLYQGAYHPTHYRYTATLRPRSMRI